MNYVLSPDSAFLIFEVAVPFALFFTVFFSLTHQIKFFQGRTPTIFSIALTLLTLVPHFTNTYPRCWDPVLIISEIAVPITIAIVAFILIAMFIGVMGKGMFEGTSFGKILIIALVAVILLYPPEGCLTPMVWGFIVPILIILLIIGMMRSKDD